MMGTRGPRAEGTSAVEFVFVLPLLVILVFGIIQFGIAFNRSQGMHAAAREGARLASIGATVGEIETRVDSVLDSTMVKAADASVAVRRYADGADPNDDAVGTLLTLATDQPCDGTVAAHAVRVDVEVTSNVPSYAITIPFVASWGQTYPSRGVFRCED